MMQVCLTKNLRGHFLQHRCSRLWPGVWLLFLHLRCLAGRSSDGWSLFPGPAASSHIPKAAEVAVASAETLSTQTNLFPAQEPSTGAAELRGMLHVVVFLLGLLFGRMFNVCVHEGLRNSYEQMLEFQAIVTDIDLHLALCRSETKQVKAEGNSYRQCLL